MAAFDDSKDERLQHEAEELMRQKRFSDAARRYQNLRASQPTDMWASLGHCSALECDGKIPEAEQILEEVTLCHKRSAPLHRFRRLFFERREDLRRAQLSTAALESEFLEEGPDDQLADLYFNQGRYIEARNELQRLLHGGTFDSDELRASLLARIGACLRQIGELDDARKFLREALDLEEDHHWTLSELAEVERAQGDHEAAKKHYEAALKVAPEDHWCRGHLAQLETEMGNRERAEALYREIITADPATPWALVELAQLIADQNSEESHTLCQQALTEDPQYPWANAHLGQLARRAGNHTVAMQHYTDALEGAPDAPWLLHEMADCQRSLGNITEARALLERAQKNDPYDATTYGYLADMLRGEGKHTEAMRYLEKSVELDADYAWAWRELAEIRALEQLHEAADEAHAKAVAIDGEEAVNDGLKAFLLRCRDQRGAALPWLERAIAKQSDYLWAWRELIDLHLANGDAAAAEGVARQSLILIPDSPPLQGLHGESLRRLGRHQEALPLITAAISRAPDVPQLHALHAEVLAETGKTAQALPCAARAAELDDSPEYAALHAQILIAEHDTDAAHIIVRELLKSDKPIQPAFELAAILAERADHIEAAFGWCERGLEHHPRDPRLLTRRAKYSLSLQQPEAVDDACAAVDAGLVLPWRDAAQIFAQAGRPAHARRSLSKVFDACDSDDADEFAKCWLLAAEVELTLGNPDEARANAATALGHDPDCVSARILSAVLAERRKDFDEAIVHLEHLDRRLHEQALEAAAATATDAESLTNGDGNAGEDEGEDEGEDDDEDERGESTLLLRQLAGLYERSERWDDARACWKRLIKQGPVDEHRVEEAAFLLRLGNDFDQADAHARALLAKIPSAGLRGRLRREHTVAIMRAHGAQAALDYISAANDAHPDELHLRMQLGLAAGDPAAALRASDILGDEGLHDRALRLLRVRILLSLRHVDDALRLAQRGQDPNDDENATLTAEAMALQGHYQQALTEAERPACSPSSERGLLIALLRLECQGLGSFLAALGRLNPPPEQHPMGHVFAVAWPHAWGPAGHGALMTSDDVLTVPPLPQAARLVSAALAAKGRTAEAARLTLAVAEAVHSYDRTGAQSLMPLAVTCLRASAGWIAALRLCWQRGGWTGLFAPIPKA